MPKSKLRHQITLAFQRAIEDLQESNTPDPYRFCDYNFKLDETIWDIESRLKEREYRPRQAESFDLPKGEFAIRPGIIVDVLDLTVIFCLLSEFILRLDKKLPSGVTAYRIRKNKNQGFKIQREASYYILPRYKGKN